tara:strand:+ start:514 stop:885 length:372 start_codon:yes stop_codon:yes gene_type:complete
MSTIRDFYTRTQDDPKYTSGLIENSDSLEETIAQIKMTLLTNKGEVLGEPNFGIEVNKYLFEFDIDPFQLSSEASSQIDSFVTGSNIYDIKVKPSRYSDDKDRDVFVLGIDITGEDSFGIFYD